MSKRRGSPERSQGRHDAPRGEELFRSDESPIGRKIAIHLIEANPDQPRNVMGDLQTLKDSIETHGVLEPLLVRKKSEDRYTLVSGERRFRAAMEAGLDEVPCIELDRDPAELVEITLLENLQRKDLTPFEEAEGFALLRDRHAYTHEKIAKAVGRSRVTVTETLRLHVLPERVRDECRRADIQSKSFLLELGRLEEEEDMLEAVHLFLTTGHFDRDALRQVRKHALPEEKAGSLKRFPKQYELSYQPSSGAAANFRVSLVVRGGVEDKGAVLSAVRELLARIGSGEIDLENAGKFARSAARSRPVAAAGIGDTGSVDFGIEETPGESETPGLEEEPSE